MLSWLSDVFCNVFARSAISSDAFPEVSTPASVPAATQASRFNGPTMAANNYVPEFAEITFNHDDFSLDLDRISPFND